tara:strand:- start:251 stop:613 length:363 start_codon:yes stop_codon:yes gene_type:complete
MAIHYLNHSQNFTSRSSNQLKSKFTSFNKNELNLILSIYAQKVSQGYWKDYAIDYDKNTAIFSIYRNTFEKSYLSIHKRAKNSKTVRRFSLRNYSGIILKDSNELESIIKYLHSSVLKVV